MHYMIYNNLNLHVNEPDEVVREAVRKRLRPEVVGTERGIAQEDAIVAEHHKAREEYVWVMGGCH